MKDSGIYNNVIDEMLYAFNYELDIMGGSGDAGMRKALRAFLMKLPEIIVHNCVENNADELYEDLLNLREIYK